MFSITFDAKYATEKKSASLAKMKHRDKQQCFLIIVSLAVGIVLGCCLSYRVLVAVGSPQPFPATPQSQHDAHIAPPLPVEPFFDIQAVPILPTEVRAVASAETHLDLENGLNPGPAPSALELRAIGVERGLVGALKSCLGSKCIDERPKVCIVPNFRVFPNISDNFNTFVYAPN